MSYYPEFEDLIQQDESSRLLEVRRSLRSIIPQIFYFLNSAVAVYWLNYYFYDVGFPESVPVLNHLSVRWLAVVPLVFFIEIIRQYHDDLYIFEKHRLTHLEGRLSLNYKVPVITFVDIRAITVEQGIFGRIFDYGVVSIGTAAKDADELIMDGVRDPGALAKLIDQFRNHSKAMAAAQQRGPVDSSAASSD